MALLVTIAQIMRMLDHISSGTVLKGRNQIPQHEVQFTFFIPLKFTEYPPRSWLILSIHPFLAKKKKTKKKNSVHRQLISQIAIVWKLGNHFISGVNTQRVYERNSTKIAMSVSRLLDLLSLSMFSHGWGIYCSGHKFIWQGLVWNSTQLCFGTRDLSVTVRVRTLLPEHGGLFAIPSSSPAMSFPLAISRAG